MFHRVRFVVLAGVVSCDTSDHLNLLQTRALHHDHAECDPLQMCDTPMNMNGHAPSQSNLGGYGPNQTGPAELRFKEAAYIDCKSLDLVMKTVSPYTPPSIPPVNNGARNGFGWITLASGTNVEVELSLVDSATGVAVHVDDLSLWIYDMDTGPGGKGAESVQICGAASIKTLVDASDTELKTIAAAPGCKGFKASKQGNGKDNPKDPWELSGVAPNRALKATWNSASSAKVRLALDPRGGGRAFQFAATAMKKCPSTTTTTAPPTTTTTTTVACDAMQSLPPFGSSFSADNGQKCFEGESGWGSWYNCKKMLGRSQCSAGYKYKWIMDKCCPGRCAEEFDPISSLNTKLGKMTWTNKTYYWNSCGTAPTVARMAGIPGVPMLKFCDNSEILVLKFEHKASELRFKIWDVDKSQTINFNTNGPSSVISMPVVGGGARWYPDASRLIANSPEHNDADPGGSSEVLLQDADGFSEVYVKLDPRGWRKHGFNGIFDLKATKWNALCPPATTTSTTTTWVGMCPPAEVNMDYRNPLPPDDGAACFNGEASSWHGYKCSQGHTIGNCNGWASTVEKCCPGACKAMTSAFSPELGEVSWTGVGPEDSGNPYIGVAASTKALCFNNRKDTLVVTWQNVIGRMYIRYSDADFKERITWSSNGPSTTFQMVAPGPQDQWNPPNQIYSPGDDEDQDSDNWSEILIEDAGGFNQLTLKHGGIPERGWNALFMVKAQGFGCGRPAPSTKATTTTKKPEWKDMGKQCFRTMWGWKNYGCDGNFHNYCKPGNSNRKTVELCCPGVCDALWGGR